MTVRWKWGELITTYEMNTNRTFRQFELAQNSVHI